MWGHIVTRTFLHCLLGAVCRACRGFEAANTHLEVLLNGILGVYIEVIHRHNGKDMETTVVMGYMIYPKPYSIYLRGTIAFYVFSDANLTRERRKIIGRVKGFGRPSRNKGLVTAAAFRDKPLRDKPPMRN